MIEIIPAIDLIEGKCVRLAQGDFARKTIYNEDPLEVARKFEGAGLKRLHVVDLDGAKNGRITNLKTLETIVRNTNLTIDFGGGIKTEADLRAVFEAGAAMASIGSVAVREPEKFFLWIERYGGERLLLGADARNGRIAADGWQTETDREILPFLRKFFAGGARRVFCTDISKDGLLEGAGVGLYRQIIEHLPEIELIASGGVGSIRDVFELEKIGCSGVIVGKAIYEGRIRLEELGELVSEQ